MTRYSRFTERVRDERGQVLAIFVGGFLAMVAFVVDGGNAFVQHRVSQNAADSAAEAGAVILAERLGGVTHTDSEVKTAVDDALAAMQMDTVNSTADYVDVAGAPIGTAVGYAW